MEAISPLDLFCNGLFVLHYSWRLSFSHASLHPPTILRATQHLQHTPFLLHQQVSAFLSHSYGSWLYTADYVSPSRRLQSPLDDLLLLSAYQVVENGLTELTVWWQGRYLQSSVIDAKMWSWKSTHWSQDLGLHVCIWGSTLPIILKSFSTNLDGDKQKKTSGTLLPKQCSLFICPTFPICLFLWLKVSWG